MDDHCIASICEWPRLAVGNGSLLLLSMGLPHVANHLSLTYHSLQVHPNDADHHVYKVPYIARCLASLIPHSFTPTARIHVNSRLSVQQPPLTLSLPAVQLQCSTVSENPCLLSLLPGKQQRDHSGKAGGGSWDMSNVGHFQAVEEIASSCREGAW